MTQAEQVKGLRFILDAVVDAVKVAGDLGAPGGTIYAALMASGATLEQYQAIMSALVQAGKLTRSGDLYFVAKVTA
jgi:hypothetical protein